MLDLLFPLSILVMLGIFTVLTSRVIFLYGQKEVSRKRNIKKGSEKVGIKRQKKLNKIEKEAKEQKNNLSSSLSEKQFWKKLLLLFKEKKYAEVEDLCYEFRDQFNSNNKILVYLSRALRFQEKYGKTEVVLIDLVKKELERRESFSFEEKEDDQMPTILESLLSLGTVLEAQKKYVSSPDMREEFPEDYHLRNAFEVYQKSCDLFFDFSVPFLSLARVKEFIGFPQQNYMMDYMKAFLSDLSLHDTGLKVANYFLSQGDLIQAGQVFKKIIKAKPDDARGYFGAGIVSMKAKRYARAIDDFSRAYEKGIDDEAALLSNRALCHFNLQQYEEALADYQKSVSSDSNYAHRYFNLGLTLRKMSRFHKALESFQQAIDIDATKVLFHEALAEIYQSLDQKEEAIKVWERVKMMDPNHEKALQMIARLSKKDKNKEE